MGGDGDVVGNGRQLSKVACLLRTQIANESLIVVDDDSNWIWIEVDDPQEISLCWEIILQDSDNRIIGSSSCHQRVRIVSSDVESEWNIGGIGSYQTDGGGAHD